MITDKKKIKKLFQTDDGEELWYVYLELDTLNKAKFDSNVLTEKFNQEEIKQILNYNYKYQDNSMQVIGETEDKRFFSLIAGPEHPESGWGASLVWLKACIANSLIELITYGLDEEEKKRFDSTKIIIDYEKQQLDEHIHFNNLNKRTLKI